MKRTIFNVFMVLAVFAGSLLGQEKSISAANQEKNITRAFHIEYFTLPLFENEGKSPTAFLLTLFGGPLVNRTRMEGNSNFSMTLPIFDLYFTSGNKKWTRSGSYDYGAPLYKVEMVKIIEENGEERWITKYWKPKWVFSGFGVGMITGEGNGVLQLRLPIVGRRLADNFWLTTGVGIMPFAKENHFGFTLGIQSWLSLTR